MHDYVPSGFWNTSSLAAEEKIIIFNNAKIQILSIFNLSAHCMCTSMACPMIK